MDKRADERFVSKAAIIYSYFSTENWEENRSVTLNISAGGLCFESRHSFKSDANLYIRTEQNQAAASRIHNWNLLRTSTLAQVRWCREIARDDISAYKIGVKYI